jgi:ribosome-binding protein aMBF1 (putative translation factor)
MTILIINFEIVNLLYDILSSHNYQIYFVTKERLKRLIGQRIVELRTKKGWSQADLARASGKDRQAIEKLENGKVNPTVFSLQEIADVLGVSLSTLLTF